MTPAVIGGDAVIHSQDIECIQESGYGPPAYGDHSSDKILMEGVGNPRQISTGTMQASTGYQCSLPGINNMPYFGDADSIEPPVYGFCTSM